MNRIASRSWVVVLLAILLTAGLIFFVGEFLLKAEQWVLFAGSPHVYKGNHLISGTVMDRDGNTLLDLSGERTYTDDSAVRKATLHWLGDRSGNVASPLTSEYALDLWGYELLNGVYTYGSSIGEMKLTLSSKLQATALEALGDHRGVVAVMNYRTGELLCAVSTPTFDPDDVPDIAGDTTGKYNGVYVNRFTQSCYTPGSIFKMVTTAAALECVPDILDRTFSCNGSISMEGSKVVCTGAHGTQTLEQAFANSCNCAFAKITELVGRDNMNYYVERFGVTEPLSFDGIVTKAGNFDIEDTDRLGLCWSGIGQHRDLVNPCSYLGFVSAVASGGATITPYVVNTVTVGGDTTYRAHYAPERTRIMSRTTATTLQELMRNNVVIKYGTDRFPDMKVCAKSGTAETGFGENNALFTGFVADQQYPLAFIVVVEEGGYGSKACIPVISKVLSACQEVLDGQ